MSDGKETSNKEMSELAAQPISCPVTDTHIELGGHNTD